MKEIKTKNLIIKLTFNNLIKRCIETSKNNNHDGIFRE